MNPRIRKYKQMNTAQLRSTVKRINQRFATIEKKYGRNSEVFKDMIAPLMNEKFGKYLGESESKKMKINIDVRKGIKDDNFLQALAAAEGSARTLTELKEQARRRIEASGQRATSAAIDEELSRAKGYENAMKFLLEFMYDTHTDAENRELYPELYRGEDGTKPDYEVLNDILAREREERLEWADTIKDEKASLYEKFRISRE